MCAVLMGESDCKIKVAEEVDKLGELVLHLRNSKEEHSQTGYMEEEANTGDSCASLTDGATLVHIET